MWDNIKAWFKHSETILAARMLAILGVITATFGAIDWTPFMTFDWTDFSWKQLIGLGVSCLVGGVLLEYARRR